MLIVQDIIPVNGAYKVQIGLLSDPTLSALSEVERNALLQVGPPIVECGGHFTGTVSGHSLDFTLPSNQLVFPSQFPLIQMFPMTDANAQYNAQLYNTQIIAALSTAMTTCVNASLALTGIQHTVSTVST